MVDNAHGFSDLVMGGYKARYKRFVFPIKERRLSMVRRLMRST